jgi:hypothetical protein
MNEAENMTSMKLLATQMVHSVTTDLVLSSDKAVASWPTNWRDTISIEIEQSNAASR